MMGEYCMPGTWFLRIVLVVQDKIGQMYTCEVLDDSFLETVMLKCCFELSVMPVPCNVCIQVTIPKCINV